MHSARVLLPLLLCAAAAIRLDGAESAAAPAAASPLSAEQVQFQVTFAYQYLLQLPEGYAAGTEQRWPLVVFLHGIGERGTDVAKVKKWGLPQLVEGGQRFPFILVAPQCPPDDRWNATAVDAFVGLVAAKYRVDPDRIYLTGLSMGGFGAWAVAQMNPDRYAAVVPICGGGDPRLAARLRDMPIWAFHGARDTTVPLAQSQQMIDAIKAAGGQPRLTIYPEAEHNSWSQAYATPELYEWLLAQRRSQRAVRPAP